MHVRWKSSPVKKLIRALKCWIGHSSFLRVSMYTLDANEIWSHESASSANAFLEALVVATGHS